MINMNAFEEYDKVFEIKKVSDILLMKHVTNVQGH